LNNNGTVVKSIINGVSTYYAGRHYYLEVNGETSEVQKTYAFGSMTIAVRINGVLKWVLADHLPPMIGRNTNERRCSARLRSASRITTS
jgi:hypothetical protein